MQLFYAPDIVPPLHTLNEEESKHCIRVLRLQCGGRIHITDGRGNLFCCEITDDNPRRCTVPDPDQKKYNQVRHTDWKLNRNLLPHFFLSRFSEFSHPF